MGTFLDATGLQALWNKIKTWVGANYQPKGSYAASNHTHNYASTVKVGSTAYNVSGGTVSLPAYPSLSGYVNTVNITGSGNAVTDISKSGNTITVTKGSSGAENSNCYAWKDVYLPNNPTNGMCIFCKECRVFPTNGHHIIAPDGDHVATAVGDWYGTNDKSTFFVFSKDLNAWITFWCG